MGSLSRFWAGNAILLGIWEAIAVKTRVPTISITAARSRKRWPTGTLVFLVAWASGLVSYLYTKEETPETPAPRVLAPWPEPSTKRTVGLRG